MYFCYKSEHMPRVICMNRNKTNEDWMQAYRIVDDYILIIVNEGKMFIKENEVEYELQAGDILLLQPGQSHVGYKKAACDYYYIHVASDTFDSFDCSEIDSIHKIVLDNRSLAYKCNPFSNELYDKSRLFIPKDHRIESNDTKQKINQFMAEAIFAFEQKSEHYKLICSCKFLEILMLLSSYFFDVALEVTQKTGSSIQIINKNVQEIIKLLHRTYSNKITGESIEEALDMNYDYLNRIFKKQIGMTIFQYLNVVRVNRAKEYLINGTMKSYEISKEVGFCDEYYFSKVFKKLTGVSPKEYTHDIQ